MSSLTECRNHAIEFLRFSLPLVDQVEDSIPSLPVFRAEHTDKRSKYRFIEEKTPNWWQIPQQLRETLLDSKQGKVLSKAIEETPPFSAVIGKWIVIQGLGRSTRFTSGEDIAKELLRSYLFTSGSKRWVAKNFERVWHDFQKYFEPNTDSLDFHVYAPIVNMSGVPRVVNLSDELKIQRIQTHNIAKLASLNPILAGVTLHHRFTVWPVHFLVKQCQLKKSFVDEIHTAENTIQWASQLNEEVVILRSFLSENISVPQYAIIREGYPRDPGGGTLTELPWRVKLPFGLQSFSHQQIKKYANRRTKFLALERSSGWQSIAISMRRFASAWENPFPADTLADIVASLENLVVQGNTEVSYKLRVRVAHFLSKSTTEREEILKNLSDAYAYRSKVFHGGYVFDTASEWDAATRMKSAKGKGGNPFHDVNEVRRLIHQTTRYYRGILGSIVDSGQLEINWASRGL